MPLKRLPISSSDSVLKTTLRFSIIILVSDSVPFAKQGGHPKMPALRGLTWLVRVVVSVNV